MGKAKIAEDRRKENGPWTLAAAPLHYKVQLALARFLAIRRGDIRRHVEVPRMAYCDRCMSFLASNNGKQMKLPALGEAEVDCRRGADRGGWRSALSLVPHRTTAVTRNATASPLVDWFSNRAAVMRFLIYAGHPKADLRPELQKLNFITPSVCLFNLPGASRAFRQEKDDETYPFGFGRAGGVGGAFLCPDDERNFERNLDHDNHAQHDGSGHRHDEQRDQHVRRSAHRHDHHQRHHKTVCKDYFSHLTLTKFLRKVSTGEIELPLTRAEEARRVPKAFISSDLASYLDKRRKMALSEVRAFRRS
ncbi:pyocin activator PrtN family protein [Mesorhizobium sp. M0955]|uniref:pyocin activator PrtN family protein n=1 Tax=unclassified Mesorhizobium TaxID=325217 RepID=UPI00333D2C89